VPGSIGHKAQAAPSADEDEEGGSDNERLVEEGIAGAILIFGPGEAKGELKKRFENGQAGLRLVTTETTDKMTEPQIVASVRHHFDHEAARQGI